MPTNPINTPISFLDIFPSDVLERQSVHVFKNLKYDNNVNNNITCFVFNNEVKVKVKHPHHRPMGPRGFWEVKASRFRDIGT
jgi:hypothetical protein